MSKNHNKEQRNRDFARCCNLIYKTMHDSGHTPTLQDVVRRAIACRPQAFYIDTIYAYDKLCRMKRTAATPAPTTPARCMWQHLAALVEAELLRSDCSILQAVGEVLTRERPASFAISVAEGMRIARPLFERHTSHRPRSSRS
ncbi:MAG: hypothetical protein K2L21_04075 [Muribaculaceae bacterium]|nr:hypothetical protein [Muribaculaceae bacterium]